MPRMIDMIRQSSVPANMMRSAARGALSLPAAEMIEILVCLAGHHLFGETAMLTLSGWDETELAAVLSDPATPREVLAYFAAPENLRLPLLPALLENPSLPQESLVDLAQRGREDAIAVLLQSPRAQQLRAALEAVPRNARATPHQHTAAQNAVAQVSESAADEINVEEMDDEAVDRYLAQHAAEIQAEEARPYTLIGASDNEAEAIASANTVAAGSAAASAVEAVQSMSFAARHAAMPEKESPVQKIARMKVGERVRLAMKGNREERYILIRDGARMVSAAVLESPKLTDAELDMFASMKNVNESVLRALGTKHKFQKRYSVLRILTMNPKTPIDISLNLLPHLLTTDLKNLARNRDVADTIVKAARKLYRLRTSAR